MEEKIVKEICEDMRVWEKIVIHIFKKTFIKVYHKTRIKVINKFLV